MGFKRIFGLIWLILSICIVVAGARAGQVVFSFTDATTVPQGVRTVALYPIGAPFTNGAGVIVTRDRIVSPTGTNGTLTLSNVYGGPYRSELQGTFTTTTNWYQFPVTNGTIQAADWVTTATNGQAGILAYSQTQADGRFVHKTG